MGECNANITLMNNVPCFETIKNINNSYKEKKEDQQTIQLVISAIQA